MPSATTSDWLHDKYMNFLFRSNSSGTWSNKPDTFYIALFTTVPGLSGSGAVEVSTVGTNYARVAVDAGTSFWTAPATGTSGREVTNANDILFGVPSANWGTITGAGIYDASTGGNLYYVSTLTTSKTVSNGDGAPKILAGQMKISRASC